MVLSKEALKARVAAYKEAMEEAAVNVAANAVVGAPPGEPGGRAVFPIIESDLVNRTIHNP